MRLDYLAILSRDAQPVRHIHAELAPPLQRQEIASHSSLAVSDPEALIVLPRGAGFLIGTLFHRYGPAEPVSRLEALDMEAIVATRGQHILDRFWGRYVAVIRTPRQSLILKDPSGMLPCYYMMSHDELILTSDPSFLVAATGCAPQVDHAQLARALALGGLPEECTSLGGVRQIFPGMSLEVSQTDSSRNVRWSPWNFVSQAVDRTFDDHAEKLRESTQLSVSSWAKASGRVLLGVSGGLDSSIVAACLQSSGHEFDCITLMTDDPLGDERHYSRAVAAHLERVLFEENYALDDVDLDRSSVWHLPKPFGRLDLQAYDAALLRVARQVGAQAIFTGNGGDNVFYLSHSARSLADRIVSDGWSRGLLKTVHDISLLTGARASEVMLHGLRAWRRSDKGYAWKSELQFLTDGVLEGLNSNPVSHPWLEPPETHRLPAKAAHIAMLVRMHHSLDAYRERDGLSVIHPLASQPLLETCLQIPSWLQCVQGFDRSVARKAFRSALPRNIAERRTKGGPQGFSFQIFHRFRTEIQERLMSGFLVEQKIIDRAGIEAAFDTEIQSSTMDISRLLMLVDTEAWVRHWQAMGRKRH